MVGALQHVFLAAPDQLDRGARQLPGDADHLADVVGCAAAAEAATQIDFVDIALLQRQAGGGGCRRQRGVTVLCRAPDLAFVGGPQRGGIHRLHRGVVLERIAVHRFNLLRRGGDRGAGVAYLVANKGLGRVQSGLVALRDHGAVDIGIGAVVPGDRQSVQGLVGAPPGVGYHHHRVVTYLEHMLDARHAAYLGVIETHKFAAEYRAGLDRRIQHARQIEVGAVDARTVDFLLGVQPRHSLAD